MNTSNMRHNRKPIWFAEKIFAAFQEYQRCFFQITQRSHKRFREMDWKGFKNDTLERLDIYTHLVNETIQDIRQNSQPFFQQEDLWEKVKQAFANMVIHREDFELAETFFNSVTRHTFATIGVNPKTEFTAADFLIPSIEDRYCPVSTVHIPEDDIYFRPVMMHNILQSYAGLFDFQDMERDVNRIATVIENHLRSEFGSIRIQRIEIINSVFYRDKAAYIIGRIRAGGTIIPLGIALLNANNHVSVDAVLLTDTELSILFSFTRSYFHVDIENVTELVNFLKTILPMKRLSEIYTSLGFYKHGKAELFRELTRNLDLTDDKFELAEGDKGMVMIVFTIPSFNVVFKVIRDQFDYPKDSTADEVKKQYQLVFRHDRAGRLVDAQEFAHLKFNKSRLSDTLLQELTEKAESQLIINSNHIVIKHLYVERRLRPLNIYLKQANIKAARKAVLDFGKAVKDLASSNIFPGDLFLKNFGVTRHERVVFYDYDEIGLLTDFNFRKLPPSRNDDEEFMDKPWFHIGENDVFPEEFKNFLTFPEEFKELFASAHSDLFEAEYWKQIQARLETNSNIHIFPYDENRRFTNLFKT